MIAITVAVLSVVLPVLHLFVSKEPRTRPASFTSSCFTRSFWTSALSVCRSASSPMSSSPMRRRAPSAGRGEARFSSRSAFTTELGAFSASSVSGSAAPSGSRPGSAGRSSCSAPLTGTSAIPWSKGTMRPYDFLTIFSDGFIAIWLLALLWLYWREGGSSLE